MTALRQRVGRLRTRTINKVQHLLLKHNLQQECPTKGLQTQGAQEVAGDNCRWASIDRLEMDQLLAQWELWDKQMEELEAKIRERQAENPDGRDRGHDSRRRGLRQPGLGLPDRFDRAVSPCAEPGQLLGPDARLPATPATPRDGWARSPSKAAPWRDSSSRRW